MADSSNRKLFSDLFKPNDIDEPGGSNTSQCSIRTRNKVSAVSKGIYHKPCQFRHGELERMLPHIFLPRKLPGKTAKNLSHDEANLLGIIMDMVIETEQIMGGNKCFLRITNLFSNWYQIQQDEILDPKTVTKVIASLVPGDSFALYIRAQNAGLLLSVPEDDIHGSNTTILSTFPASARSEDVMSTFGNLLISCPSSSIHIPMSELLKSATLGRQLSVLCYNQCDIAMPKTRKAGSSHVEVRDVPNPMLISKLLTALLTNSDSDTCDHLHKINKKVRDHVNWDKGKKLPFRRSGMWFTVKVVLHLLLANGLGESDGTFLYKLILLKVVMYYGKNYHHGDADVSMHIMAKMSHRLCKLETYLENNNVGQAHIKIYERLKKTFLKTLKNVRSELESQWTKIVKLDCDEANLRLLVGLDFVGDAIHLLPGCKKYIRSKEKPPKVSKSRIRPPPCPPRHRSDQGNGEFPLSNFGTTGEEDLGIVICDFEQYVRKHLGSYASVFNCQYIRKLLEKYISVGKTYYLNDPIGGSQMVLTSLKVMQVLDSVASAAQPLLREHRSGVDIDIIKDLLLVKLEDMKLAHDLELYFCRRNLNKYSSLIEEEDVCPSSFSAKYASGNRDMCRIKEEILELAEQKIKEKKEEVQRAKLYVANLERTASMLSHTYYTETDRWQCTREVHSSGCRKCSLESEAKNYRVGVYERPLPRDDVKQNAIVFELLIPKEIACLRDALYFFRTRVCSNCMSANNSYVALWKEYGEISRYLQGSQQYIDLGSTTRLFKNTNYSSLHPDTLEECFIVNNGYNCYFVAEGNCLLKPRTATIKSYCTFSVPYENKYHSLEWTLRNSTHSQNQVLAKQIECPKDISLTEFKEFGSLRAGHRLQLRNIYRVLQQDTLSFQEEPVFSLICQAIWQAGPQSVPSRVCRDSHLDLEDFNFSTALLQLLEKTMLQQSENWQNCYTMLNIVMLTARTFSLAQNETVKETAKGIILKCREQVSSWTTKIEKVLQKTKAVSRVSTEKLRLKLILINVCCALTFWVDERDFLQVMNSDKDVVCWLTSIAKIKDNIILNTAGIDKLCIPLRNMLRWVRTIAVRMEDHIHKMLHDQEEGFTTFARKHFPGYLEGRMLLWASCEGAEKQIYESSFEGDEGSKIVLHMDVIRGDFLVDGAPVGYLPKSITTHEQFQRVFSNTIFEVKPGEAGALVTSYQNHTYSFRLDEKHNLIVTENQVGNQGSPSTLQLTKPSSCELVSHEVFEGDVPFLLKENYSHWWDKTKNIISFRPKSFLDSGFLRKVQYVLDLNSGLLEERATGKHIINVNSHSYKRIRRFTDRLEHHHHVHVLHSTQESRTTVEFLRMALQFDIDNRGQLISREYPGMKVKNKQKFGTFVGLKQGLLLESVESPGTSNPVLLVPHGNISILDGDFNHQKVIIEHKNLSKPQFFAFEVNEHLKQLRAGQSHTGWLFLALIHAATASPLVDLFTGLSGSESAIQLLQSAHCWSCQPLDKEASKILEAISKLSPHRTYYPVHMKCMENVQWPEGLTSLAAHDGYQIIAKKLIADSERLGFLYDHQGSHAVINYNDTLVHKSYWQHQSLYTEQARGLPEFDLEFQAFPPSIAPSIFEWSLDDNTIISLRNMAHLCYTWSVQLPQPSTDGHLKSLLLSESTLAGIRNTVFYPTDATSILNLNFKESWLDLYNFARSVKKNHYEFDWTVMLCVLAFIGTPLHHLQILHAIAVYPEQFIQVDPPPYSEYTEVSKNEFDSTCLKDLFRQHTTSLDDYMSRTNQERRQKEEVWDFEKRKTVINREHITLISQQVENLAKLIEEQWKQCPTKTFNSLRTYRTSYNELMLYDILEPLNNHLTTWYMNRELKLFLEKVETIIFRLKNFGSFKYKALTHQCYVPFMHHQQYCFLDLKLHDLLQDKGYYDPGGDDGQLNNIATVAEKIFRSGQSNLWNLKPLPIQHQSPESTIQAFPWKVDESCNIGKAYMNDNKQSWEMHYQQLKTNVPLDSSGLIEQLKNACMANAEYANHFWKEAKNRFTAINQSYQMKVLRVAGLFPRVVPSTLLPLICRNQIDTQFRNLVGAAVVVWTHQQQANRCLMFAKAGMSMVVALKKELETCTILPDWSPKDRPEWLLFELEMNLKIRSVQVKVANAMLQPDNGKNAVMQLNMGEGKTSVIVPLVVAILANKKQLCRVTVLKSLFHMNWEALSHKIGGLLNQRMYSFPCRRDMVIGSREALTILQIYEECVAKRGVVLTLPEHRLSFQLKGYEHSRNGNFEVAHPLLKVQEWLKENVRDALDESDAILHVKYQLVYTIGEQVPVGGKDLRWTVAESLLKLVPDRLLQLIKKYGNRIAECSNSIDNTKCFPHCRLLNITCYRKLCEMLANDILEGKMEEEFPDLKEGDRQLVFKFLTSIIISKDDHKKVAQIFDSQTETRNSDMLLILRGLLACGVLFHVLNKRWRVNYGVNPIGYRLMAVPFRAKDVAAERTEFGHPDVAILSTILSYYYSGLNEKQLDQCFELLFRQPSPEKEYHNWIHNMDSIDKSIQTLSSLNLEDHTQRRKSLNPALSKNMSVIDFWLGKVVFPKESKQFGWKMLCSPWDLCADDMTRPVTGFSGTNDTKLLLPIHISQKDLPELLGTNGEVLHNLLLPENNNYACLPSAITNLNILQRLVKHNIPLLLDVGALMTEYSNRAVAWKWLNLKNNSTKKAAIYFDKNDRLFVIDRRGLPCLFELSPYRSRMEECVIYLDDFHTRGTDLKIPRGARGCVTLGKGVTKDKLVQGCMRMRMIGEGHTLCFWASKEVNDEIHRLTRKPKIDTKDVLTWAMENSRLVTRDGILHWVLAGSNYTLKKMAHRLLDLSNKTDDDVRQLGERCSDREVTKLKRMYGTLCEEKPYPAIADSYLVVQRQHLEASITGSEKPSILDETRMLFSEIGDKIVSHCHQYVPTYKRLSHLLDEEQERELEHELEEEREVQRPPAAKPVKSHLASELRKFVQDGTFDPISIGGWMVQLPDALRRTKLWPDVQPECWGHNIYATKDFVNIVEIENSNDCIDQFLRPPVWIAAQKNNTKFMLLSPHEVNELIPVFRSGGAATVLHMYATRLRCGQDTLLQNPKLSLPSSTEQTVYENFSSLYANLSLLVGTCILLI